MKSLPQPLVWSLLAVLAPILVAPVTSAPARAQAEAGATAVSTEPGATAATASPAGPPLTLAGAMRRALEANPNAGIARREVDAGRADYRRLRASVLPQLNVSGSVLRHGQEVAFDLQGSSVVVQPRNDWQYTVTLDQPVYSGGRATKAIHQADLDLQSREAGARQAEEGVLLGTASDYLAAVQSAALVDVERRNLEVAQRRRDQARDFFDAGETTKVDLLRAETAIKEAQRRVAAAEGVRDGARSRLREDLALDELPALAGNDAAPPPVPAEAELLARAEKVRPEIERARLAQAIADLEVGKQKGARLPVVRAQASYHEQAAGFPVPTASSLALLVDLPLFDSGERSARIAHAEIAADQARMQLESVTRAVREDVRRALLDLHTAERTLGLAREQLQAGEAEYAQAFDLYRAQEATALDLEAAETALADARRAVVAATLDHDLAALVVWARVAALKDTLIQENKP